MNQYVIRLTGVVDERILRNIPGAVFMKLRISLLRRQGAKIGRNVIIGNGTRILCSSKLTLGDNVSIARNSVLDARGGLILNRGALIGFESIILTSTHKSDVMGVPVQYQGMYFSHTEIGEFSWLGTRCIVMPGANIGANTIVGSGSVVTRTLDVGKIFAGSPARELRIR